MNLENDIERFFEEDDIGDEAEDYFICPFDGLKCDNHKRCCVDHPEGYEGEGWFSFCKRNVDRRIGAI